MKNGISDALNSVLWFFEGSFTDIEKYIQSEIFSDYPL